jgi:hypothetical protein
LDSSPLFNYIPLKVRSPAAQLEVFCELMEKTNFRLYDAMEAAAERYGMSFQEALGRWAVIDSLPTRSCIYSIL